MNIKLAFENVSSGNFLDLKSLVIEQASHHRCTYRGRDEKFVEALERDNPVARVVMVRDSSSEEPLGYILYNHIYGFKGQDLYIEDILVSQKQRGHGVGYSLSENLKDVAREKGVDAVSWVVARDNEIALRFYKERMLAKALPFSSFDCSKYFSGISQTRDDVRVEEVTGGISSIEEQLIESGVYEGKIKNIQIASVAEHSRVFVAQNKAGKAMAVGIVNSNFSSFRTVYGYKLELMELTTDTDQACMAFEALLENVANLGRETAHTGHLNLFVDSNSLAQTKFVARTRPEPLMMSDAPNSFLDPYAIGRDILYGKG